MSYSTERRLTWVDLNDVAEAAAIVLSQSGHEYATYELVGTDAFLCRSEIATILSEVLGRPIRAERVNVDDYLEANKSKPRFRNSSEDELNQTRAMFQEYDTYGMPAGNSHVLSMLLGHAAGSYKDFVRKIAEAERNSDASSGNKDHQLPEML